jgi:dTDP-4-amino-4,6-dideoxygalactose transaminase
MIPLASPDIREEDINKVVEVLRSGMLVQGAQVAAFEQSVASYLEVSHVLAASNGTATLHMALVASGIGPGDGVIVPSLSYIATANVVELVGARPVFVDVDNETFCIDTARIEAAITPATKAITPVHEFGLMADMAPIMELAEKHGLIVIEDAACALGATDSGKKAGSVGNFGSFSLHPRKNITSGEGGLLVCKDEAHAAKVSLLRNHGLLIENGSMTFPEAGFNYRLTDIQASLAHSQFGRFEEILSKKQKLAAVYFEELKHAAVTLPVCPGGKTHTWQSFHVLLDDSVNRDELIQRLRAAGVGTNLGAQCMPDQEFFARKYGLDVPQLFPNGLRVCRQGLVLPLYEKLTENDILKVVRTLEQEI